MDEPTPMTPTSRRTARWSTSALQISAATVRQMERLGMSLDTSLRKPHGHTPPPGLLSQPRVLAGIAAVLLVCLAALTALFSSSAGAAMLHAAPPEPINLCMFTNREPPALAVINTIFQNAAHPEALIFHVVVSEVSCCQAIIALSGRYAVQGKKLLVHTLGELTRVLLNDGFAPPWTLPPLPDGVKDAWLVRPAGWDLDGKHNSPLNHLRFYSACPPGCVVRA
jgi:hypothetical protein